ncbi:exostosin domain-containing protein [Paenibacillus sp.]|uniref:exostosin domain-containing protein n=1 Tax=Paenibacillus sp. TaxID=58172 RepID=UPI002D72C1EA|nr:exostosin family protein [Paenibacillus sp.]HZG55335.1 exostosin family protein [Paenibacillus sp.]
MNIHILPVPSRFRPERQKRRFPVHNEDYGIEQDFLAYLKRSPAVRLVGPKEAQWHYLPVYWTRWAVNTGLTKRARRDLSRTLRRIVLDEAKTFTVCQHKDAPFVPIGRVRAFLASRKGRFGLDAPLLSTPHRLPRRPPAKKHLASFVGNVHSHPLRRRMFRILRGRKDVYLQAGNKGERFFVRKTLESYATLCPRGMGGSSFRFFESLQLGVAPIMIGDLDTRPFKRHIDWSKVSFRVRTPGEAAALLRTVGKRRLLAMGRSGAKLWRERLTYGKWCPLVLRELQALRRR